jgi:hypothetical protein
VGRSGQRHNSTHIKMTAFSSDTCGENTSSKQLKEVARIQLDEEGAACHLFGYRCNTLFRKWRSTGLDPMEERDRANVRNKKNQDAWIRSRYRNLSTIGAGRIINLREKKLYMRGMISSCATSAFCKVIGGLSEYIDDARVESAVRDIQFESARERAKYVDKSQESIE